MSAHSEAITEITPVNTLTNSDTPYFIVVIKMIACTFFWGGTFIAGKFAGQYATAPLIGFVRYVTATICLLAFLELTHNSLRKHKLTRQEFIGILILALTGVFLYNMFFFWGLQTVPASRAALIVANNPLIIALGASIIFKEKLTKTQCLGIFISTCGAITILSNGSILDLFTQVSYGDLIIIGCVLSWAVYSLVGKIMLAKLTPLIAVAWTCLVGTFFFIPFIYKDLNTSIFSLPRGFWFSAIYLGIFGSAIAFVWFYDTIKALGAARTGNFISFVPVFATLLSIFILGENITLAFILGGSLTMFGVYIANKK